MTTPIPIALCGKLPAIVGRFIELIQPEYRVVHHCVSAPDAQAELPVVLKGEKPSTSGSPFNSNLHINSTPGFKAIVVGAGFTPADVSEMRTTPGLENAVWLHAAAPPPGAGPPAPEVIVARVKKGLKELGIVEGGEDVKPGLYSY